MILINELSGNIIVQPNIVLSGSVAVNTLKLEGNIINGGTRSFPDYHGEYEFTPNHETQILNTKNTALMQNIVINPIPSNYGQITWNGAYILVS